jgi:hypothetical protein
MRLSLHNVRPLQCLADGINLCVEDFANVLHIWNPFPMSYIL